MAVKQIKIFTSENEQSATINPDFEDKGLCLTIKEEIDDEEFVLYMSYDEAKTIGKELVRYAEEKLF